MNPTRPGGGGLRKIASPAASKPKPAAKPVEKPVAKPAAKADNAPEKAPASKGKMATGVKRLDQLLAGGIAPGSAVLVYGPPFLGKEILARRFFQCSIEAGIPGLYVLTNAASGDVRKALRRSATYQEGEEAHMARFIDTYSRSIGAEDGFAGTEFLDGALDLNGITLAVNKAQAGIIADHDSHALVFDSVSTLVAYSNAATTFRFLQTLIGRTRRVGATSFFLLDHGMHSDADVQMFKHLMTGVIEVRDANGKPQMRIEGLGGPPGVGWVEYKFDEQGVDVIGSFAAGRIR